MKKQQLSALLAVAMTASLMLTGCGGGNETKSTDNTSTNEAAANDTASNDTVSNDTAITADTASDTGGG